MKVHDIIQPILTHRELELLQRVERVHEDPSIHTNPDLRRQITRLMKMGLVRMLHDRDVHYEVTDKGQQYF